MFSYLFVLLAGLAAGLIGGVIGTGSSIILLPILVYTFGPKQAVPIMALAAVMANLSRVLVWWKQWSGARWRLTRSRACPPPPLAHAPC